MIINRRPDPLSRTIETGCIIIKSNIYGCPELLIITYLNKLIKISYAKLNDEFGFTKFDSVNISLIKKALENDFNIWLDVNNKFLGEFYEPIIFTISAHYFETNYCESKLNQPKTGEKYKKGNGSYEVVSVDSTEELDVKLICTTKKGKGMNVFTTTRCLNEEYTKLAKKTPKSNRKTFEPMLNFVKKALQEKENIPLFPHKFAIVAPKNRFENCFSKLDKKAFPYTYITGSGERNPNIPLDDFMFFVVSDYETIQDHIFDESIILDNIVFLGNKYDELIQQDINRGYFKHAVFVGENKPDIENLLTWQWTLPEYQYFGNSVQAEIIPLVVKNEHLSQLTKEFLDCIENAEKKYSVNISKLSRYISYFYPSVILIAESRLHNRIDDLVCRFKERAGHVLGQELGAIEQNHTELYGELVDIYENIADEYSFENNAKSQELRKSKEIQYLLVSQDLSIWEQEVKKLNWQNVKIITTAGYKKLNGQKKVTLLSLEGKEFFEMIRKSNHHVQWLLYEEEYRTYEKYCRQYDNELINEYRSDDRFKLTDIKYTDQPIEENPEELIDRIFSDDEVSGNNEFQTNWYDYVDKEIIFTDGSKYELSANSTVILMNALNKPEKCKVAYLKKGDRVRIYRNQDKGILFDVACNADGQGSFQNIIDSSLLWKNRLKQYCGNDENKAEEVSKKCGVATNTVKGWLNENSNTKFPHDMTKLKEILSEEYDEIESSRKNYNGIMIALGRDFSDEISEYIISGEKGRILSNFDDDTINGISSNNMPIKEIEKIKTIDLQE